MTELVGRSWPPMPAPGLTHDDDEKMTLIQFILV